MSSNFEVGVWYEATPNNIEWLTPGELYKCVRLGDASPDVAWINKGGYEKCVFMSKDGSPHDDVVVPKSLPEAPKELDPVRAASAISHQKAVTREALFMLAGDSLFNHAAINVVGGAPRDWDYNIPAQDIDIWLKNRTFGDDQYKRLRTLFEPLGATVRKVTNNDYARDGEYIHYIYNVVWQDVDLQFIFVEDPSVEAVIQHVCCNFSEISWDWRGDVLKPTLPYKTGRMARVLEFKDDKGRSPRDNYVAKMAARYPDHKLVLPSSLKHLEGTYGDRCITASDSSLAQLAVFDGTWGPEVSYDIAEKFNTDVLKCIQEGDWVVALNDFTPPNGGQPLMQGKPYKVRHVDIDKLWVDNGGTPWYKVERFRQLEPEEYIGVAKHASLNENSPFEPGRPYVLRPSRVANNYIDVLGSWWTSGWHKNRFSEVTE